MAQPEPEAAAPAEGEGEASAAPVNEDGQAAVDADQAAVDGE